jgi:hypothetical protein
VGFEIVKANSMTISVFWNFYRGVWYILSDVSEKLAESIDRAIESCS